MESYEQFYSRTLNSLLAADCSSSPRPQRALSAIQFRGRRLLQPVLSADQRVQMAEHRQTAVDRDRRRHTDDLLQRVHDILHNIQLKTQNRSDSPPRPAPDPLRPSSSLKKETLRLLNHCMQTHEASSDPQSPASSLASLCVSLTGSYARLPDPRPSSSPQRSRRARNTAGHILISRPVSASELQSGMMENETRAVEKPEDSTPEPTRARLNRSYDVENPSPSLLRPQVTSRPSTGSDGTDRTAEEQQMESLELMCERLEQEHAHQISELLMTQQRQTQHLRQELQRKLSEQSRKSPPSSELNISWIQPSHTQTKHTCATHTSHTQMLALCVDQVKCVCRLTAVARGFLTRRLLETEKITHLRKTIQDSREFLRSLQTDPQVKRVSVSHQDLILQQRVSAQLRAALQDVHHIFFTWTLKDRLNLLRTDRERRSERTRRETKDSPGNTRLLSLATQKTLDRKTHRKVNQVKAPQKSSTVRSSVKNRDQCLTQKPHYRKYLSLG